MKYLTVFAAVLPLLAGTVTAAAAPPAGSPIALHGQLKVCGTKLCGKDNTPIQLRGMSMHGTQWYRQCINAKSLDALANDWKADVLRISTYVQEGGYETNPRKFTDIAHTLINQATARGLYVIVDWHMLDPGDPHHNLARAKTFFAEIARVHKDKINILYEVANEPNGVSWERIRLYHQQIIPVIRNRDANAVILLGTRGWSSFGAADGANANEIVNNPVNAANIMYTFHFYAASHRADYLRALSRAADKIPVFVTEFGTQKFTGNGANDFVQAQKYIDLMAKKKISWVNWNFSDDGFSGAAFRPGTCPSGDFAGKGMLKPAGKWVREQLRAAR
jgi:endoglucanase